MKFSPCLVLLVAAAAAAHAAVNEEKATVNDVHDFQEDVHLTEDEADAKIIDLDEDGGSGDYYDDDDDDYDDEDDDYYDDDDDEDDPDWASGDYDDDDDEYLEEDEDEDITFDDDKDDLLYEYHAEDYEGDDYDFTKDLEESIVYQPPQVQIRDHGKSEKDETVTVAEPSPSSSRNLLVSVFVASGLASFALFTLAFVMCFCNRRSRDPASAKQSQLPFVIHHGSSPLNSSIIKPGKYQPVATQENRSNHSIENANSVLKQQAPLEEKLLP